MEVNQKEQALFKDDFIECFNPVRLLDCVYDLHSQAYSKPNDIGFMAHKIVFLTFIILAYSTASAKTIHEKTRTEYALKFHEAFILQSVGQSTSAFNRFQEAFCQGTESGESAKKLQIVTNFIGIDNMVLA